MKIQKIELSNFKGIRNAEFDLNGKSTVFFGINGSGKSSVLRAINLLFSNIIRSLVDKQYKKQGINIEESDITFGKTSTAISLLLSDDDNIFWYDRYMDRKNKKRTHLSTELENIKDYFTEKYLQDELTNMPIFANYGTHRLVIDIPLRIKTKHIFDKQSAFEKAIESKIDFRTFFEWYRYQEDIENEIKAREDNNYNDRVLTAVRKAITRMIDNVENLRIVRSPRLAMKVDKGNISLNVDQLSDGEKCTLALFGDLTRRLSLANPLLDDPLHGEGIVLIDEIELHMHPKWQRRMLNTLSDLFPNIQFIVTTHSPQILGEVNENYKLFGLNNEDEFSVTAFSPLDGWDSNDILEILMNTGNMNLDTKGEITKMFELIDSGKYDEAETYINKLEKKTNNCNPDIINAKMLIQKGRRGL